MLEAALDGAFLVDRCTDVDDRLLLDADADDSRWVLRTKQFTLLFLILFTGDEVPAVSHAHVLVVPVLQFYLLFSSVTLKQALFSAKQVKVKEHGQLVCA